MTGYDIVSDSAPSALPPNWVFADSLIEHGVSVRTATALARRTKFTCIEDVLNHKDKIKWIGPKGREEIKQAIISIIEARRSAI